MFFESKAVSAENYVIVHVKVKFCLVMFFESKAISAENYVIIHV
jgi:hypothetical protein